MNRMMQIYHKPEQVGSLIYPGIYNPPRLDKYYLFMESDVMRRQYERLTDPNFRFQGILSPNFEQKLKSVLTWGRDLRTRFYREFDKDKFEELLNKSRWAVVSLTSMPPHDVIKMGAKFHPQFPRIFGRLFKLMGERIESGGCNYPVYFNYFAARAPFWEDFLEWQGEALRLMVEDPELDYLMMHNSGYMKEFPEDLRKIFKIDYWPYHPFVAERLISIFIQKYNYRIGYY